jgi:hypothetical protein
MNGNDEYHGVRPFMYFIRSSWSVMKSVEGLLLGLHGLY